MPLTICPIILSKKPELPDDVVAATAVVATEVTGVFSLVAIVLIGFVEFEYSFIGRAITVRLLLIKIRYTQRVYSKLNHII